MRRLINDVQMRALDGADGKMIVEGYATTFNTPYKLAGGDDWEYQEQVEARAFDGCEMADVVFLYNHEGRVMARTGNSTLSLAVDAKGLLVRADLSGTEAGRSLYAEIKGGYVTKMSMQFTIHDNKSTMTKKKDDAGREVYTESIGALERLYDVSAVSIPANDGTDIQARCAARVAALRGSEAKDGIASRATQAGKIAMTGAADGEGGRPSAPAEEAQAADDSRERAAQAIALSLQMQK